MSEKTCAEDERSRRELANADIEKFKTAVEPLFVQRRKRDSTMSDAERQKIGELLRSRGFEKSRDGIESWCSDDERKHFSRRVLRDATFAEMQKKIEEQVAVGEFWFYSYYILEPAAVTRIMSREIGGLTPVLKPHVRKPAPTSLVAAS
jgi:hypothetical protein